MAAAKKKFEDHLDYLTKIASKMESGQLSLEAALKEYEQGIRLARQCQKMLANAEQKVQYLSTMDLIDDNDND